MDLKLNLKQVEAITRKDGIYRVISGAGTGKTLVLAYRIAHLIESGVKPDNILALTYTRKAAQEMRSRIMAVTKCNGKLSISTFHSFCYQILKSKDRSFNCKIIDDTKRLEVFRLACGEDKTEEDAEEAFRKIDAYKEICVTYQDIKVLDTDFYQIYKNYEETKKELGMMDYADLIYQAWSLLKNDSQTLRRYRQRYHYINVDEFQDTSKGQFKILKLLLPPQNNLFVVGDDYQSIYSYRCARPEFIIEFEKLFPDCQTIVLEQNYRSRKKILQGANTLIEHNSHQVPKALWTANGDGPDITVLEAKDERHEAAIVSREAEKLMSQGVRDIAVLYRTNWWGEAYQKLGNSGIKLMTIHKAKGLEFNTVFVVGMIEGIMPHSRSIDLEEERRLCYVAITRAKERLYLCYPARRQGAKARPSRFIEEILQKTKASDAAADNKPVSKPSRVNKQPKRPADKPPALQDGSIERFIKFCARILLRGVIAVAILRMIVSFII
jgi:superfamily I DNA/RNA helicase